MSFFCCTGVGIYNRGIESFFRESFDGLNETQDMETRLLKGAGKQHGAEYRVPCIPRTSRLAGLCQGVPLGAMRFAVVEQLTSFPFIAHCYIRRFQPDVIFYAAIQTLAFNYFAGAAGSGVPFRLVFSNGGPCHPPFDRTDFVHQVAPFFITTRR